MHAKGGHQAETEKQKGSISQLQAAFPWKHQCFNGLIVHVQLEVAYALSNETDGWLQATSNDRSDTKSAVKLGPPQRALAIESSGECTVIPIPTAPLHCKLACFG